MGEHSRAAKVFSGKQYWVIAGWMLLEEQHRLERDGRSVKLEPKTTELLGYLARHAGEPLSREKLFMEVWPGVVVGDEALTTAINKIRRAFDDDRQNPKVIETISKMGYRLIAPVERTTKGDAKEASAARDASELRIFRHGSPSDVTATSSASIPVVRQRPWRMVAGVVFITGLLGLSFYALSPPFTNLEPTVEEVLLDREDKPSLAVLPFDNLSGDSEQEYFVDGITEDLITDLSKIYGLNVISRNSVFAYKDTTPKPQDVGLQLGVSHVMEGSVRKVADQVRINIKFIDATSGLNLWAERFDGNLEDVLKLQDQVTRRVVAALAIKLSEKEQGTLARERTTSIDALQLYFMGRAYYGSISKQENEASRKHFRRAIELDPGYAQAYAALALTHLDDWRRGWSENPEESIDKALAFAQQAITVDEMLPQAHFALGFISLYAKGQHDLAIEKAKAALALDPNYASGYALLSSAYFFSGLPEKSLPLDRKAIQLDPSSSFLYYMHLGRAYYFQGRYQEALDSLIQAAERNYNYIPNHVWLAASYARLDQADDAEWEADQVLTLSPNFTIQQWMRERPYKNPDHRKQLSEGLRMAGLP